MRIAEKDTRIAALEARERELVDRLLEREEKRAQPPAVIDSPPDSWEALRQREIAELEKVNDDR